MVSQTCNEIMRSHLYEPLSALNSQQLAEIEELKGTGIETLSNPITSSLIHQVSKASVPQLVRRNARVNPMALTHLSLHEAEYLHPHLVQFL